MNQKQIMDHLQRNPQILEKLAGSRDGQMLMERLQQNGQAFEQAAQTGQQGDIAAMANLIRGVMADREGREMLERLAQQIQK